MPGVRDQRGQAEAGQHQEPQQHHRPEQPADLVGAAALDQEQADQDDQRQRHHQRREVRAFPPSGLPPPTAR